MTFIDLSWYKRPAGAVDRTSAGGIVVRDGADAQIYMALVREGTDSLYILPKGGVKKRENYEQAARREIEEEAGLSDLTTLAYLGTRQRLGFSKRNWITTHYYLFLTRQVQGKPSDISHDYELHWFPVDQLPAMFWPDQQALIVDHVPLIRRLLRLEHA